MGDVQGSSIQGVNYPRRKLSECNYFGAIFLGGNCSGAFVTGEIVQGGVVVFPRKNAKFLNFITFKEVSVFKNCRSGIWGWRFSQHFLKLLRFMRLIFSKKYFLYKKTCIGPTPGKIYLSLRIFFHKIRTTIDLLFKLFDF